MTTNEKDTCFLQRLRTDHHRYHLRAVVGHCVFGAVDYCFCEFGCIGNNVKGVCTMIKFCLGILVGFAIAAMVQVGKDNDNDMGCNK